MDSESDKKDKTEARKIAVVLIALLLVLGLAIFLLLPSMGVIMGQYFAPGLGLKESAVIAFFVTTITMIVLAIAAGDGLLGEIQFILGGFLLFFIIVWLSIAWIF